MKPSTVSPRPCRTLVFQASLALGLLATVHALEWTKVDNFATYAIGSNINGQGGWVATNTNTAQVVIDPDLNYNKVLHHPATASNTGVAIALAAGKTIPNNSIGTLFLRVRKGNTTLDNSFGLNRTGAASPGTAGNFEVMAQIGGTGFFRGRDGGTNQLNPATQMVVQPATWYKVWLVANNATANGDDTWKYFIQGPNDSSKIELVPPTANGPWNFRNGTALSLIAVQLFCANATGSIYYDDIYIDNSGENLGDPTAVANPDTDGDTLNDAWEDFHFGNLSRDGTADADTNGGADGLTDLEEYIEKTDPNDSDTDNDLLKDGDEVDGISNLWSGVAYERTNPLVVDSDGDGLTDFQENGSLNTAFGSQATNPNDVDTDDDGHTDRAEIVFYGTNPNNADSTPMLLSLISTDVRNGSFELMGPAPGVPNAAKAENWDTDPDGDVPYWNLWTGESTASANSGAETGGTNTHGIKHAYMENGNAAYNLTDYIVAAGDVIAFSYDHTGSGSTVRGGLVYNSGTDLAPAISRFPLDQQALTEVTSTSYLNGRGNIYVVPAGSPAIGKKVGFGLKSTSGWPYVDKVILTIPAADADHDGLTDDWEDQYFGNDDGIPTTEEIALYDSDDQAPDNDGFTNLEEQAAGSNPTNPNSIPGDIDADGLADSWELAFFQSLSNPNGDPGDDPDGDHDTNAVEEEHDNNPNNRGDFYSSTEDSVPDSWKAFHGISSQTGLDDLEPGDPVGDGLINGAEFTHNTNPNLRDTDGDGLEDGDEITAGANPLVQDSDGDGLLDGEEGVDEEEPRNTLSPILADTDGDSFSDKYELDHGTYPNDANSFPTQPTGFSLVEDFQGAGMTVGQTFNGVNGWFATINEWATVAAEPIAGGADQVGYLVKPGAVGSPLRKSLADSGIQIRQGQTGTLFFQLRCASAVLDHSFGLSDVGSAAAGFGDFEAQLIATAGTLRVRDGNTAPNFYDSLLPYQPATWMNIWMVADNTTDTVRVYYQLPGGSQTEIVNPASPFNPFDFRNGVAGNPLNSFLIVDNAAAGNPVYIDNIFVDPTATNLAIPTGATKPGLGGSDSDNDGLPDTWENTYFSGLGQGAADDFEHDGTDNLTEFRLGLIPNNGSSRFAAIRGSGGAIQWPSVEGVTFKIERSTTLGAGSWSTLQPAWPGTAGSASFTDPEPPPGRAFYKITLNP
ncbi:hypothetical protein OKA05_05605 [Luteolibacter arcticus]|uniref:Uncharacterized protein n=1 Tax=Luteolibacter arcticus TaxID=1581411 RepID=A0ABT3GF02_9BACT|nr:hypothetical protein [Luteolibacter arcticus]MCW1922018.1 hypothetical protein [Luteolibacter arcticus]